MKLRSLVVALALATGVSAAASAQGALYINPIAMRISNTADYSLYSFLGYGRTSQMFYGVNIGGYYDLPLKQKFEVGIDVHDSILHGNNASINSFLVGPRIAFQPFQAPLHIYVEPMVGAGTTRAPNTVIHVSEVQYGVLAGVDDHFSKHVSWRIVEVGYSSLRTASGETIGASEAVKAANVISITMGLTFRLP